MQEHSDRELSVKFIDGMAFCRDSRELTLSLPIAGLQRLADLLVEHSGFVRVHLQGSRTRDSKHYLLLSIEAELALQCQRCLGEMRFPVQLQHSLQLVAREQDLPEDDLDDDTDVIVGGREMSVVDLVEEEILLTLPMAPSHETCFIPVDEGAVDPAHPFAGLLKLKKH